MLSIWHCRTVQGIMVSTETYHAYILFQLNLIFFFLFKSVANGQKISIFCIILFIYIYIDKIIISGPRIHSTSIPLVQFDSPKISLALASQKIYGLEFKLASQADNHSNYVRSTIHAAYRPFWLGFRLKHYSLACKQKMWLILNTQYICENQWLQVIPAYVRAMRHAEFKRWPMSS